MGKNLIGPEEIRFFFKRLNLTAFLDDIPQIQFSLAELRDKANNHILILGCFADNEWPINIINLRKLFGVEPEVLEPCFYNQDWYLNEEFIKKPIPNKWFLVQKDVLADTRGLMPDLILEKFSPVTFPSAILCAYSFFAYYINTGTILWKNDFVWCSDKDHNGDRIYVGKYSDIGGINKNGFSIHRHLSLRKCYGAIFSV